MTIKTVCKLTLKKEEGYLLHTDYEVYPLASVFANSDDDAIVSYITKMTSPHIEVKGCEIMEVKLLSDETLRFYRVEGRNTTRDCDVSQDYLVVDVPFIDD